MKNNYRKLTKIFLFTYISFGLTACDKPTVTAEIEGLGNGNIIVRSTVIKEGTEPQENESVIQAKDGRFSFNARVSDMTEIIMFPEVLAAKESYGELGIKNAGYIDLLLVPGEKVNVSGTMGENYLKYSVKGSEFNKQYAEFSENMLGINMALDSIGDQLNRYMRAETEDEMELLRATRKELNTKVYEREAATINYITSNSGPELSPFLVLLLSSPDATIEYYNALDERLKNSSRVKDLLEAKVDYVKQWLAESDNSGQITQGSKAPEFTLKDISGKDFSLSGIKDKYIVLDFWGSWCVHCVRGFPKMKEYYEKYKNKVEFIGINCRDTDEKWKTAIKTYSMDWVQLKADDNEDILTLYEVTGFPTKIIIDKAHGILAIYTGEYEEFYDVLDELFE